MTDDHEQMIKTLGMVAGRAVGVLASQAILTGQDRLGLELAAMFRDGEFDRLAATLEVMSHSADKALAEMMGKDGPARH